jgi:3'(2'), 5'-bisphosphate nucleotidase
MIDTDTEKLLALAARAGDAIMAVYARTIEVSTKDDQSPLTEADLKSHRILVDGLTALTPDIPVFSEEDADVPWSIRSQWQRYWLIDPLDGTKEFINRNGEFTVNIALIEGHEAVFGVVGVPAQGVVFWGDVRLGEAFRREGDLTKPIRGRQRDDKAPLVIVASRNHGGERLEQYLDAVEMRCGRTERTPVGSSLKLCILAEGKADLYPRLGPTSEWDIAAADAVLRASGGALWAADGSQLRYNTKESVLNPEFIAVGDSRYSWKSRLPQVPD